MAVLAVFAEWVCECSWLTRTPRSHNHASAKLAGFRAPLPARAAETRQNSANKMSPRFRASRRNYATALVPWSAPGLPPVGLVTAYGRTLCRDHVRNSRWRGSLLAQTRAPTLATPAPIGESSDARPPAPFAAIMHSTSDSTGRRSGFGSVMRVASWSKESKCSLHMPLSSCGKETTHVHHTHHEKAVCHHARR